MDRNRELLVKIELDRFGRIFSTHWVLHEISTTIDPGTSVCILGANGAGKTTLLKAIAGNLRPTEGSVQYDGRKIRLGTFGLRKQFMFLEPDLPLVTQSAAKHVGRVLSMYGRDEVGVEDEVEKWLDHFRLAAKTSNKERFSRGEAMKLWLATLFVVAPPIWFLDEPHQWGLDAQGIEVLEDQIGKQVARGGTVVFTSQWPAHAARLADQVLVIHDTHLAYDGPAHGIVDRVDMRDEQLAAIVRGLTAAVAQEDALR